MPYLENQEWWVKMTYQFSPPIRQKRKGFFNTSLTYVGSLSNSVATSRSI